MSSLKIFVSLVFMTHLMSKAQTNITKADSLYSLGNYASAINEYAKSDDAEAQHQIARAYNAMGNYNKSIVQYRSVIEKDSSNVLAKFELGKIYDKIKKYAGAIALFQKLTEKHQDNPEFFYYLGKAQRQKGDYKNGNQALIKAVELDSTHLRSIYLLGRHYVTAGEPGHAHEILDLGLRTAPDDVALINLKALAHFNNGYYKEAAQLFERLVELGEYKPFIFKKLGYAHFKDWEYEKAKEAYWELEKFLNMEPDAYFGLGEVFLKEKQLDSAEVYFKKSIEERRYIFDDEYSNLGRIARLKNNNKKALEYYTKAWKEDPTNQFSYWQVCITADEYYKDPQIKLNHYQKLLTDFEGLMPFLKERAQKRVLELKEELHYAKN